MPTIAPDRWSRDNPAALIDHTLLQPLTTAAQIAVLCEEAVEYGFAAVCLPPVFVGQAAALLYGSDVKLCSVVSFPCGYSTVRQKVNESADLVALGVAEIDLVVQLSHLLENRFAAVEEEIAQVVMAARGAAVKVIIECCYLTPQQMQAATEVVIRAGAAFVKTSTGFGPGGARLDDVSLLAKVAAGRVGIKAAGGIRDLQSCLAMLAAGATRIGTSAGVQIVKQWQAGPGAVINPATA